jgi:hypothetical protein
MLGNSHHRSTALTLPSANSGANIHSVETAIPTSPQLPRAFDGHDAQVPFSDTITYAPARRRSKPDRRLLDDMFRAGHAAHATAAGWTLSRTSPTFMDNEVIGLGIEVRTMGARP